MFTPIQLLGKGSFGEVYLVRHKSSGKHYAMKVLSKKRIVGQNLTKYAYTEKNILSYLRHPFIVALRCSFQTEDKLCLILDYCPGGDLGKVLQREKNLSEDRARIYLAEVLLALEELHNREIIYRDLKPDNVVLDADGHRSGRIPDPRRQRQPAALGHGIDGVEDQVDHALLKLVEIALHGRKAG